MQICANSFENFRESVANLREFIAYLCKCVQTHSRTFANLSRICVTSCVVLRQMPRIPYLSPGSPGRQQKSPAGRQQVARSPGRQVARSPAVASGRQWVASKSRQPRGVSPGNRRSPAGRQVASRSPGRQAGRQVASQGSSNVSPCRCGSVTSLVLCSHLSCTLLISMSFPTTFNHKHNFHNAPHNNNRKSANKQNFLSTTLGNLECLIEHTTNAKESLYLEGEGGRSKSKTLRMDGSSFLDHWS